MKDNITEKDKRLEWLFKERRYRTQSLTASFMQYAFIIFLYIFNNIFGWWWLIYMILYIVAVLVSPSERKVQRKIDKELGLNE